MSESLAPLFALLVLVPGVAIPVYVMGRLLGVLRDRRRQPVDRVFAVAGMAAVLVLIVLSVYLARDTYVLLGALASSEPPVSGPQA